MHNNMIIMYSLLPIFSLYYLNRVRWYYAITCYTSCHSVRSISSPCTSSLAASFLAACQRLPIEIDKQYEPYQVHL